MTANLLAHTKLFKAGIARSGAYNRTLTPFGFQNEERTYWDDPKLYYDMSPFSFANQIKTPLLLIHGDADDNPGTFPINSERLFNAIKGFGGTVRLVYLLYEAHGYRGRENLLHMLWEVSISRLKKEHLAFMNRVRRETITVPRYLRPCRQYLRKSHRAAQAEQPVRTANL